MILPSTLQKICFNNVAITFRAILLDSNWNNQATPQVSADARVGCYPVLIHKYPVYNLNLRFYKALSIIGVCISSTAFSGLIWCHMLMVQVISLYSAWMTKRVQIHSHISFILHIDDSNDWAWKGCERQGWRIQITLIGATSSKIGSANIMQT